MKLAKLCIALVFSFITWSAGSLVVAQNSVTSEPDTTTTSLTIGYMGTDFEVFPDSGTVYDFGGAMQTLMLSTDNGALSVGYGREGNSLEGASTRVLDVFAITGGNAYIVRELMGLPIAAYVPIRFNVSYRFSSITFPLQEGSENASEEEYPTRHFGTLGLGAGLGGWARVPVDLPLIGDSFVVRGTYVVVPGAYGMFGGQREDVVAGRADEESTIYAGRTHEIDLEFKVEKVLGGNIGATIGFTQRWQNRTPTEPSSFADVIDTVLGSNEMNKVAGQSIIRVGINW